VVGYQTVTTENGGFCMLTPTFENVDATEIDLQSIKLFGDNAQGYGLEQLQILDDGGNVSTTYTWVNGAMMGVEENYWGDDSYGKVENVTFSPGDSFILYTGNGSCSITFSGSVKFEARPIETAAEGFMAIGNCSPVAVDLQGLKLTGENAQGYGLEQLQLLDKGGNVSTTYTFVNGAMMGVEENYWGDDSYGKVEDVTIEPGSGFILYTGNGSCVLTIPAINK
jgi:hypothetical protein